MYNVRDFLSVDDRLVNTNILAESMACTYAWLASMYQPESPFAVDQYDKGKLVGTIAVYGNGSLIWPLR